MRDSLKKTARPFLTLLGVGVAVTLVVRVCLAIAGATGALGYSYRVAASPIALDGGVLDKLLVASTGSTLVGFMLVAALAAGIVVAAVMLYAHLSEKFGGLHVGAAALWGAATAVVTLVCAVVVVLGLFSGTQINLVASMASGAGMGGAVAGLLVGCAVLNAALMAGAGALAAHCMGASETGTA